MSWDAQNRPSYMTGRGTPPLRPRRGLLRRLASLPMIVAPSVKAGGWGVGTPSYSTSVADFIGAGWHARMSSRQR